MIDSITLGYIAVGVMLLLALSLSLIHISMCCAPKSATASDTLQMVLPPRADLSGVPSSSIMASSMAR